MGRGVSLLMVAAALWAMPAAAQVEPVPEQPAVVRPMTPIPPERLEQMVPKHPGYLGALAPENLKKARPAPPFDVTGTWFIDLLEGLCRLHVRPALSQVRPRGRRGAD